MAFSDKVNGRINVEHRQADLRRSSASILTISLLPQQFEWMPSDDTLLISMLNILTKNCYRGVPSKNGKPVDVSESTYGGTNDYQESQHCVGIDYEWRLNSEWAWTNRAAYNHIELEQKARVKAR